MKKKTDYIRTKPCKLCDRAIEKRNESPDPELCCWCYEDIHGEQNDE